MDWRAEWALLDKVQIDYLHVWYRFQYKDGTPRCIVANGKRLTTDQVCAMLDRAECEREAQRICTLI